MNPPNLRRRDCYCPDVVHVHGTAASYDVHGCRCLPCRSAHVTVGHHGTHTDYTRHLIHGDTPCPPCVDGEHRYQAARYQRDKQRRQATGVAA